MLASGGGSKIPLPLTRLDPPSSRNKSHRSPEFSYLSSEPHFSSSFSEDSKNLSSTTSVEGSPSHVMSIKSSSPSSPGSRIPVLSELSFRKSSLSKVNSSKIPVLKDETSLSPSSLFESKTSPSKIPTLGWSLNKGSSEESSSPNSPPNSFLPSKKGSSDLFFETSKKKKNYEVFVMTGERMISLAKTPAHEDFKSQYPNHVDLPSPKARRSLTLETNRTKFEEEYTIDTSIKEEMEEKKIRLEDTESNFSHLLESEDSNSVTRGKENTVFGHSIKSITHSHHLESEDSNSVNVGKENTVSGHSIKSITRSHHLESEDSNSVYGGHSIKSSSSYKVQSKETHCTEEERDKETLSVEMTPSQSESDLESLSNILAPPVSKVIDVPSAFRLAKRLYSLDGFKKSDVARHLSKNSEYNTVVAEEYSNFFSFSGLSLDDALRIFLERFNLTGETQERERVLMHFSRRYLTCNPESKNIYRSFDALHTLTCALMLLNTDLHGGNLSRKMTSNEFIQNLRELNDGDNFPRELLKSLYSNIKRESFPWAVPEPFSSSSSPPSKFEDSLLVSTSESRTPSEFKRGYVMRKSTFEANGKKTKRGKRSWKMFFLLLRDLELRCSKDEKVSGSEFGEEIRIHHALAIRATDYVKKQFVFRLTTADKAVYLFQTSDEKELLHWIDAINYGAASGSSPKLPAPISNLGTPFQRPLLPSSKSKLSLFGQLEEHEKALISLRSEIESTLQSPLSTRISSSEKMAYGEKLEYLKFEILRYETYILTLRSKNPVPTTTPQFSL